MKVGNVTNENLNKISGTGKVSTFRPYVTNIASAQKPVAFKGGMDQFLVKLGKTGNSPLLATLISSVAALVFRVPIIMSNKKPPKEETTYAAAWCGVMAIMGIAAQLLLRKSVTNFSTSMAQKFLGSIKNAPPSTPKAVAGTSKVVEFLAWTAVLNVLNIGATAYLKRGIDFVNEKIKGKPLSKPSDKSAPKTPQEIQKQKNTDHMVLAGVAAAGGFMGLNLVGNMLKRGPIATNSVKSLFNVLNKNFNITGKLTNVLNNLKNSVVKLSQGDGVINKAVKKSISPIKWLHSEKGVKWLSKQADASDKWLERSIILNMVIRPLMLLPTGQGFAIISALMNEILALAAVKTVGKVLVNKLTPKMTTALKVDPKNQAAKDGVNVLVDQLIKNVGLVCIALGFLNNTISNSMVDVLNKFKKGGKTANNVQPNKAGQKQLNFA